MTGDRPKDWLDWLPWVKYCYNSSYHTALHVTPFMVVYGREPPSLVPLSAGRVRVAAAEDTFCGRDEFLAEAWERLLQAQQYAKKYYDDHHRELTFEASDWVWLRLLHRSAASLSGHVKGELGPRYHGPYQVLDKIGSVAYHLRLPPGALHNVFHVGLLKKFHGEPPSSPPALPLLEHGRALPTPAKVLCASLRRDVWHVLVQWTSLDETEASWEPVEDFKKTYPDFELEDKLFREGGRDVMWGIAYQRRGTRALTATAAPDGTRQLEKISQRLQFR